MGSLNFNSFKNNNYSQKKNTYTDLFLDLSLEPFEISINSKTTNNNGKDIKVAYDLNAIKNSIVNLFNTIPGDRILLPDYGCDLRQYVFERISETMAKFIGRIIKTSIEQWEPRVTIANINVDGYVDKQEYRITLKLEVPFLERDENFNISGLLNKQGFTVV
ncbi:MAG: GPW/gp25 family protein [Clostridia bacterium]|nr:GPW/gp25 family protein [Clostridia bacterium]